MRLLPPLKRLLPAIRVGPAPKRDGLLFERLFWGALSGGLATILFAESPVLDTMEMNLLEWRYKTGYELTRAWTAMGVSRANESEDIALVTYDDEDQFDLESESTDGGAAPVQAVLARLLPLIEAGQPLLLVLDMDLRGKADPDLVTALRAYKSNVILALPGTLDNPNDLPAAELRKSVLKCAFDHVLEEQNGLTCRMPISANMFMSMSNQDMPENTAFGISSGGEIIESLPEVIAPLMSSRVGVGPSRLQISDFSREDLPIYIKFSGTKYPTYKTREIMNGAIDPRVFSGKVVIIGTNFSQKVDNTPRLRTPLNVKAPNIYIQAEAISTLTKNEAIRSFPRTILHHLLLLIGGALGALSSTLPMGRRTTAFLTFAMLLVAMTQVAFQYLNLHVPVLPLLAVLMLTYIFGTLIYLDTDLRLRNKELALAREAMQVRAEEERQRIAEDLHDETLPALSAVARMADRLTHEMDGSDTPRQMREKLDGAISEMRRVINDLHPSVLETMGFKPALENLLAILERETNIHTDFIDGDADPSAEYNLNDFTRLQLYRIVQESLNNVQKHSKASEVKVLIKQEDGLQIDIIDNGKGIDLEQVRLTNKTSHGLVNIRQRAQLIGAQVDWKKPLEYPTGTQVIIRMPLTN
ncbi:MAG: CHASE2 domain-containing protein [Candidatus Obscuribacter sp.]|nr:CHASE2 domain-containing protein [Candidatus Obscuribacter sp.]